MATVPSCRVRRLNEAALNERGDYVLLWMVGYRRTAYNFALDRAVQLCRQLKRPLLVFEPLRVDYPWASVRLHTFLLQGMADNARACAEAGVTYFPYVEPEHGRAKGLLLALAERACAVVTDDYPSFFIPQMISRTAEKLSVCLEAVDSHGLLPLRVTDRAYPSAYIFRRALQKLLPQHLLEAPSKAPLRASGLGGAKVPAAVQKRWPAADDTLVADAPDADALARLPIDQEVGPAVVHGGRRAGLGRWQTFLDEGLGRYAEDRNHPDREGQSGLSPYLHFGYVSPHELFADIANRDDWTPAALGTKANGQREGFWGLSPEAESFLDEAITWRELGANMCVHRPHDYAKFESLPPWAQETLAEHQHDPRQNIYTVKELAESRTDDPIWNAAQNELRRTGRLHNYMRMLWGKRILEWTRTPRDALAALIELNNRYGVDGRDANSYAGIFWTLGRYDRPWPTHNIFGKVRMMSSASTKRKLQLKKYLETFGTEPAGPKAKEKKVAEAVRAKLRPGEDAAEGRTASKAGAKKRASSANK